MPEIQDILKEYGQDYKNNHKMPLNHHKVIRSIEICRTSSLGGHIDECDNCGHTKISYNSCKNRHCPKCQTLSKERWIESRKDDLLPVQYFHAVFTIPEQLNAIVIQNQKLLYGILFKSVSETLLELSQDKKYLGAQLGFLSILHTWGQNLMHHPHLHCVIPGGGLSKINKWIHSKKNFFIPVKVLSRKFRGKFLFYLKQFYSQNMLSFLGKQKYLGDKNNFQSFLDKVYSLEWVVYCKPPFKNSAYVLEYLSRYSHKVAISNNRIIKVENGYVTFKWRDYKNNSKQKLMVVTAEEFIRRFLFHILPERFVKIRYFGILGNRNKNTKLLTCKKLTGAIFSPVPKEKLSPLELMLKLTGKDISICTVCGYGKLKKISILQQGISPPVVNF
jgi:hypothetical protein